MSMPNEFNPQVAGPPGLSGGFGKQEQSELVVEAFSRLKHATSTSSRWRQQAGRYFKAYGGDPWPDGVKADMEATDRPPVNPNYSTHMVNTVLGLDMSDRQEIRFKPVDIEPHEF